MNKPLTPKSPDGGWIHRIPNAIFWPTYLLVLVGSMVAAIYLIAQRVDRDGPSVQPFDPQETGAIDGR